MEFLLINHPLDCPVCDKGGECPLQNQAMSNGRGESRFAETGGVKRTFPKPINISAQVLLDRERCVLCARCTRFSEQIAGDPFIALAERGALQQVAIYEREPFESYFSGNTIQICPVGALTSADYRFRSRPFDLVSTPGVAEHDACGAAIRVDHRRGKVMRRLAGNDPEVNEEWISDKDRFAFRYAQVADRITYPMVREDGELRPASWPEAFAVAARGLQAAGAGRRAHRRTRHRRGRLRLRQVRPRVAADPRHRLPRPPAQRRGGRLPGVRTSRCPAVSTTPTWRPPRSWSSSGSSPRTRPPRSSCACARPRRRAPASSRSRPTRRAAWPRCAASSSRRPPVPRPTPSRRCPPPPGSARTPSSWSVSDLAGTHGALTALADLAARTGARLAWVPRRAGDRGAIESGALPNLLPGGRPVADAGARVDAAAAWGVESLSAKAGRDGDAIVAALLKGELGGARRRRRRPRRHQRPRCLPRCPRRGRLRRQPRAARDRRDPRGRRRAPGVAGGRQGRHVRDVGGTYPFLRGGLHQPGLAARPARARRHRRRAVRAGPGSTPGLPHGVGGPLRDGGDGPLGRRPPRARRRQGAASRARQPGSRPRTATP